MQSSKPQVARRVLVLALMRAQMPAGVLAQLVPTTKT
jgi:hypothetical protein